MKLIEPIKNLGALSVSDAPIDQLEEWAPIGRDLLNYLVKPVFDILGNRMIIASTDGGLIYDVDLVSGNVTSTGVSMSTNVANIKISPDGLYVLITKLTNFTFSNNYIYEISTWQLKDSYGTTVEFSNAVKKDNLALETCIWASDSLSCTVGVGQYIVKFTITGFTHTSTQVLLGDGNPARMSCIETNGTYFYLVSVRQFFDTTEKTQIYLTQVDSAFLVVDEWITSITGYVYSNAQVRFNPSRDDLLVFYKPSGNVFILNPTTLATKAAFSSLNNPTFVDSKSIKITATHLITRSLSTSPYWNYKLLSDYTLAKSLPPLNDIGDGISIGTDYTVIEQDVGIALLDSLDSPITQQNPDVVTGDSYTFNNNIYDVLIDNNDQPDSGSVLAVPTWLDKGAINPLKMFDGKLDSLTTSTNDLTITITPNQLVSGIALFSINAVEIQVTMTDPTDGLVFDTGVISMLDNSGVNDWFAYYFAPYIKKSDFVSLSLPPYPDATIVVTIIGNGSSVSIGEIVLGRIFTLGISQFGTSVGILDFSEKEQDQFGNFSILQRKFSKRADYDVKMPTNTVSGAQRILSNFRATPAVWVGDENREETIIYGYYKSFDIVLSNPALSDTSILVEGL